MGTHGGNLSYARQILRAVTERGYVEGWQLPDLLARQVCKLLEEAAELFLAYPWPAATPCQIVRLRELARLVKEAAGAAFDDKTLWRSIGRGLDEQGQKSVKSEAADVAVVLAMIQEIQGISGYRYDVWREALAKACRDVDRGQRNGK